MNRLVGLAPLTVLELDPPRLVECAAAAGYDAAGFRLIPATAAEDQIPTIGLTPLIRETKARIDDTGLRVLDVEILRLVADPSAREIWEPLLETAAFLGATELLVAGNDPDLGRTAAALHDLAELAAVYGVTPNLEFMPWTNVPTVETALAVVDAAAHDNAAVLVDAIHFARSGCSADEVARIPRARIRYAQMCDAHPGTPGTTEELIRQAREDRLYPGEGIIDLVALIHALPLDLPLSIESPVEDHAAAPLERARAARLAMARVLGSAQETLRS